MREFKGKNPYMDYRNTVPFMDLSGYIVKQPKITEEIPAKSLQQYLKQKRCSTMINLTRLQYKARVEVFKNGSI